MAETANQTALFPGMEELPRLSAVEIGGWPGLGATVRVDLAGSRTVLVGKNGAGKSLVVEGISRAAGAIFSPPVGGPRTFRCEVDIPGSGAIGYEYELHVQEPEEDIDLSVRSARVRPRTQFWSERCWKVADGVELWRTGQGMLSMGSATPVPIPPTGSILSLPRGAAEIPAEVEPISELLSAVSMVPAGVPRNEASARREILIAGIVSGASGPRWRAPRPADRAGMLARTLVTLQNRRRDTYDEFVGIVQKFGLARDIQIKIYKDPEPNMADGERQDFASVLFDEVNVGLLSDGTLRIFEIVIKLLRAPGSVLLIEEPETAIHPGLLRKLLALVDTYALDRQVVVSTHSPIVVDWCKPEELRLVERVDKATVVRALSADDVQRVRAYLDDEGTFGDYIYSRSDEG
jgi:predicted ATPase